MNKILSLLLLVTAASVNAQMNKKLDKILNFEYVQLNPAAKQSNVIPSNVQIDPSLTQKGDTTGIHNGTEFLQFRDEISNEDEAEIFKLLRTDWVSNQEYDAFCDWVLDSLYREAIYNEGDPENYAFFHKDIAELLAHGEYYKTINGQDSALFDPANRKSNRQLFYFDYDFDWRKEIRYYKYIPEIHWFNLGPAERFYKKKDLDERMWTFKRSKADNDPILVARDRAIWAKKSVHPFDAYYNLANHYYRDKAFRANPVQGVLGNQAKAFLFYLEDHFQKQINAKNLPYRIALTLPNNADLTEAFPTHNPKKAHIELYEKDMTEHWQITNANYLMFLEAARDSILREAIYENRNPTGNDAISEELIGAMLKHPDVYYDGADLEWKEFDPTEPERNRELFPFNYKFKWQKKLNETANLALISKYFSQSNYITEIDYDKFMNGGYSYIYYWQDLKRKSGNGAFSWDKTKAAYVPDQIANMDWNIRSIDMGNGMRRSANYGNYIVPELIYIYPGIDCRRCNIMCWVELGTDHDEKCDRCQIKDTELIATPSYDFKSNPEALVTGLTYAQALAFYNWKYLSKAERVDFDEIIYDELLPSEAEFERIQAGESVIKKSEKIEYPTPFFRYVVHVYAK